MREDAKSTLSNLLLDHPMMLSRYEVTYLLYGPAAELENAEIASSLGTIINFGAGLPTLSVSASGFGITVTLNDAVVPYPIDDIILNAIPGDSAIDTGDYGTSVGVFVDATTTETSISITPKRSTDGPVDLMVVVKYRGTDPVNNDQTVMLRFERHVQVIVTEVN